MSQRDDDIEFDFFDDEPETQEATQRRRAVRAPGRRAARPRRPSVRPPSGFVPIARLLGLVAFVIVAVLVLVTVIGNVRDAGREAEYRDYMEAVGVVAQGSTQVGRDLNSVLTTPGIRGQALDNGLAELVQRSEQQVVRARELDAPGPLRQQHLDMIEALQFRVIGLNRIRDAFAQTARSRDSAAAGRLLADQAQRLVASDVVWDDLFRESAMRTMNDEGVTGVEVPDSNFLSNTDLATQESMTLIFERTRGVTQRGTRAGLHGTNIESVQALPAEQTLAQGEDNTVTATADLAFAVTVANGGDSQEVRIPVTLTIQQNPRPIEKRQVIDLIDPGEERRVVFRNLGQIVTFAQKTTLRVNVEPVQGEARTDNNTAEYSVIFTLVPTS